MEFASSQDHPQLPGGRQDLGREASGMWAADSGAVLVARPLGVETPRQRWPGLSGGAVHTGTAKGPPECEVRGPVSLGSPAQVTFRKSVD